MASKPKSFKPKLGSWRITDRDGVFSVEKYQQPSAVPFAWKAWCAYYVGAYGNQLGESFPTFDSLPKAERWLDEILHPEKYTKTIRVYEPTA